MAQAAPEIRRKGRYELAALARQERDLARAAKGDFPFYWDQEEADRVVGWVQRYCRHVKGEWAGQPLLLENWQAENFVAPLFAWKRHSDGTRRFRNGWLEVARKNGKSLLGAGIGLYCLVGDGEPGGEVYSTATKKDQARIIHDAATKMVRRSPKLRDAVRICRHNLSCEQWDSKFEPLSSESNTLDGLNPSCDLRDEVHAWTDPLLVSVLDTASGARRQPLTIQFTTAGTFDKEGIGWKQHDYVTSLLDGAFEDEETFGVIYAIDEKDDPFDPMNWGKANPNLGISVKLEKLLQMAAKAKRSPEALNDLLRLHLNRWTSAVTNAIPLHTWDASDGTFDENDLNGADCHGGLDLSSKLDLTAFVLVFPRPDGGLDLLVRAWVPETRVEEEALAGRPMYREWVKAGVLIETPGDVIDYEFIEREIVELGQRFNIQQIAYDPWNATMLATKLQTEHGFVMVQTRQGMATLSEPTKHFIAQTTAKKVRANRHPVLRWCIGNLSTRSDANANVAPDKKKSKNKIDCAVAAILGVSRVVCGEERVVPDAFVA